jgi:hypothetical protein
MTKWKSLARWGMPQSSRGSVSGNRDEICRNVGIPSIRLALRDEG